MRISRSKKRDLIIAAVEKCKPALGLDDWALGLNFYNRHKDLPKEDQEDAPSAQVTPQDEYAIAQMDFVLDAIDPEDINEVVIHELVHCIQSPLESVAHTLAADDDAKHEWVRREKERVVRHITRVLQPLLENTIDAS